MKRFSVIAILVSNLVRSSDAFAGVSTRPFAAHHSAADRPKLILISGAPGTGKSTFGMSVALDQGILKCISTDTVRAVMRSFVREDISPALHRSSYAPSGEEDDPVKSWKKTCTVLEASLSSLVLDAIERGQSLVLEGVHIIPSSDLVELWEASGGIAIGCLLTITDEEAHKGQLRRRGIMTGKGAPEQKKIKSFKRIRAIHDEMVRLARTSKKWLLIEQNLAPDPLDLVQSKLWDSTLGTTGSGVPTLEELSHLEQYLVQVEKDSAIALAEEEEPTKEQASHRDHEEGVSL